MPQKGQNGHLGTLDDPEFCQLFLRLMSYRLTGREIKYLIWRFYFKKSADEIAKLDERCKGKSGINLIIQKAYKKIKQYNRKLYALL